MDNTETTNMSAPAITSCSACDGREDVGGIHEYYLWRLLLASAVRPHGTDPEDVTEGWNEAMLDACIALNARAIYQAGKWRILGNPRPFFSSQRAIEDKEWPKVHDQPAILWATQSESYRTALVEALSGVAGIRSIEQIENGYGGNDTYCRYEYGPGLAIFVLPGFSLRDLFFTIDDRSNEVIDAIFSPAAGPI